METKKHKHKKSLTTIAAVAILIAVIAIAAYTFSIDVTLQISSISVLHCWIQQFRNGILISQTYHTMSETNFGKNQTRNLLGGVDTYAMLYVSNSNDTTAFDATWLALPGENLYGGLGRGLGVYSRDDTGNGKWNITYTWTATSAESSNLYGLSSRSYAAGPNTLCYAEQQGAGNVKNLGVGDTLKMTVQGTAG